VTRDVGPAFARAMRPWVLGAWIFLTLGITAGSYWAYYTLGWGGWWFWDPVENASLMPWLAATALLHSCSVSASRNALRAWTVMLGVIAFSMSMVGTFLVRSGILTSVHAFAVDPARGSFILALLAIYIGGALTVRPARGDGDRRRAVQLRQPRGEPCVQQRDAVRHPGHRAGRHALSAADRGVGHQGFGWPALFQPVSAIFAIPMLLVLAVGPLLRWRNDKAGGSPCPCDRR
jgi:cytochrome c-type biogenesis protein CcmF